jgi:hypothetical protein
MILLLVDMTVFIPVNNHFGAQPFHPNLYFQKHWQRLMLCEQPFLCGANPAFTLFSKWIP